jgi:hypothetical protein
METDKSDAIEVERLKPERGVSREDVGRVNDLIAAFNKVAKPLALKTFVRLITQNDLFVARGAADTPQYGRIVGMVLLARIPTLSHGKGGQSGEVIVDRNHDESAKGVIRKELIRRVMEHAEERGFEMLYFPHCTPEDRAAWNQLFPKKRLFESPTWCVNLVLNGTA